MFRSLKTQKQLHSYAKEQLNEIGECESIKKEYPEKWDMFLFYFKRHPDYPAKFNGLTDISIGRNADPPHYLEVRLVKDNTLEACSFLRACITRRKKDRFTEALRQAIYPQVLNFKRTNINRCVICNSWDNPHVDHHEPQFIQLKNNFLQTTTLAIPTEFDETPAYKTKFKSTDAQFQEEWGKYHLNNAKLRILCKRCNLSRPKFK
jgi:hypothetical protein